MVTYSNSRNFAEFSDWPIGGSRRGKCEFSIETNAKGSRAIRRTTNKFGVWCKPKMSTYFAADRVCFVDGSDGKTYVLADAGGFFYIMQHDLQHTAETVWPKDAARYAALQLLLS